MIYLIDDDKSIRRGFELFLKSASMAYKSLESCETFLEQFKTGSNDLLVLDISLPGMNELDLLKKLEKKEIHIPVIIVTSFDDAINRDCCRKYGVKAFLRKPVDTEID